MKSCFHPSCGRPALYEEAACKEHWTMLPVELRRRITSAQRKRAMGYAAGPSAVAGAKAAMLEHWSAAETPVEVSSG